MIEERRQARKEKRERKERKKLRKLAELEAQKASSFDSMQHDTSTEPPCAHESEVLPPSSSSPDEGSEISREIGGSLDHSQAKAFHAPYGVMRSNNGIVVVFPPEMAMKGFQMTIDIKPCV
jgi:hypothetical protein